VGTTYTYTDPSTGLPATINTPVGGYFPSVEITQLSLSLGNIDPNTGQPLQQTGGLNMLTAATFGRGDWVIRLGTPDNDPAIAAIAQYQVVKQSGPRVIGVTTTTQSNTLRVQFDSPVLATSFTTSDIQLMDAGGNPLTILSITPIVDTVGPANQPAIPGSPADFHDLFQIVVSAPVVGGFADITIGPGVADYAGFGMNQNDNFTNGEATIDPNNGYKAADAYHGFVVLGAAASGTLLADFSDGAGGLSLDGFSATGLWHTTSTAAGASTPGTRFPKSPITATMPWALITPVRPTTAT